MYFLSQSISQNFQIPRGITLEKTRITELIQENNIKRTVVAVQLKVFFYFCLFQGLSISKSIIKCFILKDVIERYLVYCWSSCINCINRIPRLCELAGRERAMNEYKTSSLQSIWVSFAFGTFKTFCKGGFAEVNR